MNSLLFGIIGALLGAFWEFGGIVVGGFMGYLLGEVKELRNLSSMLRGEIDDLKNHDLPAGEPIRIAKEVTFPPAEMATSEHELQVEDSVAESRPIPEPVANPEKVIVTRRSILRNPGSLERKPSLKSEPRTPNFVEKGATDVAKFIQPLIDWFTSGNLLVRIGVVVLFAGLIFLIQFASEQGILPIEARLAGGALIGTALIGLGWKLRTKRKDYALVLQGGGVATLYLIAFASFKIFEILPAGAVFVILVLLVVLTGLLSVLQDAKSLAIIGTLGGFAAPILASTGSGNYIGLFSYYALLNVGIFGIAWFKSWRMLNLVGFLCTFGVGGAWGIDNFTPEILSTTEPFLVGFWLMYIVIGLLFALKQTPELKGVVDGTLTFGLPVAAFTIQYTMVEHLPFGIAISSFSAAVVYILLAGGLFRKKRDDLKALTESYLAIGVSFLTLTLPFALDAELVTAGWAFEGAGLIWIGIRQKRLISRLSGMGLLIYAFAYWMDHFGPVHAESMMPVFNGYFLSGFILAIAALIVSYWLEKGGDSLYQMEKEARWVFLAGGVFALAGVGFQEIDYQFSWQYDGAAILGWFVLMVAVFAYLSVWKNWKAIRVPALMISPIMLLAIVVFNFAEDHPFTDFVWLPIIAFWIVSWGMLFKFDQKDDLSQTAPRYNWAHALTTWSFALVLAAEFGWALDLLLEADYDSSWYLLGYGTGLMIPLIFITKFAKNETWPWKTHQNVYAGWGGGVLAIYLAGWSISGNLFWHGEAVLLPYIPFLNAFDLVQIAILLVLIDRILMWRELDHQSAWIAKYKDVAWWLLGAVGFIWLTMMIPRSVYHWTNILSEYKFDRFVDVSVIQTGWSVLWTIIASTVMVISTKKVSRTTWIAGATLLGIVVVKLFLIDLERSGTIARIISFMATGVIILAIGYFSPVPPAGNDSEVDNFESQDETASDNVDETTSE